MTYTQKNDHQRLLRSERPLVVPNIHKEDPNPKILNVYIYINMNQGKKINGGIVLNIKEMRIHQVLVR